MKREELKSMGLNDEQVQKIMDIHGADIEKQKSLIYTLTAERDSLKQTLAEANTKLEGYDPQWKDKADQAQNEAQAQVEKIKRGYLLKEKTAGLKFSSESARRAFLADLEAKNLPIQEDQLLGLDDFVKKYRESDPGAFVSEEKPPVFSGPTPGPAGAGTAKDQANAAFRAIFSHD